MIAEFSPLLQAAVNTQFTCTRQHSAEVRGSIPHGGPVFSSCGPRPNGRGKGRPFDGIDIQPSDRPVTNTSPRGG